MFEEFLYTLRRGGLKVSLTEWMSLMEALDKGLHRSSFTGFYHLCRCLLVKNEADFDRFDRCFLQYFRDVPFEGEVSQELMDWLDRPDVLSDYANWDEEQARLNELLSEEEIEKMLQERMQEQNEEHNGGNYWVGTHGMSTFGNSGLSPKGIRVGGQGMHRRAFRVAGERRFRDFRKDNTLDTRQFQVALKRLRQYSGLVDLPPTEFDVDNTIQDTAEQGGMLTVRYKRPRQNTVKVHNCPYGRVYTDPSLLPSGSQPTDWLLSNLSSEYKVIFVGDAQMAPYELTGGWYYDRNRDPSLPRCGLDWLLRFRDKYPHVIWLNPSDRPSWGQYWCETYDKIAGVFPMFPLTVQGLEDGMKKLLAR